VATVTNFKDRITDLAGSLGSADDNAIEQWVLDGCYDVLARVKQLENPMIFGTEVGQSTSEEIVELDTIRELISVDRGTINCKPIDYKIRHLLESSDSIYEVTEDDPVYYIHNGKAYVKPSPTSSKKAFYTYIPEYIVTNFGSGESSINSFPKEYYEHILLYAAAKTLDRQLLDLLTNTDITAAITAAKDAITKAGQYMDSSGATTTNVVAWLNDEDGEMASTVMSAVSAELSTGQASSAEVKLRMERDLQSYQWTQERRDKLQQEYLSKFPQPVSPKGGR
jgi:hypothetical protein